MWDDSKRLDALEKWQRETDKALAAAARALAEAEKSIVRMTMELNKTIQVMNTNMDYAVKRIDGLERSVNALDARLKKAKIK